jgi:hypothetical protein
VVSASVASGIGRIRAGGFEHAVTFAEPTADVHADIDAASHATHDQYGLQIVGTVVGRHAEAVTSRLTPRAQHISESPDGAG